MKKFLFLILFFHTLTADILKRLDNEIREIYNKISPSLFEIKTNFFFSTGFAFDKNTIITILPEVDDGEEVKVFDKDGNVFKGKIKGWDDLTHIAVIKTEKDIKVPEFSKFENKFPQLALSLSLKGKGSFLLLSIYNKKDGKIYIEGNISPSFSGAPIINVEGKIVGILRGKKYSFDILENIDWRKFYKHYGNEKNKIEIERPSYNHKYKMFIPEVKLPEIYYKDISYTTIGYTYSYILKRVNLIKEKGKVYPGFLGILIDYEEGVGIYIKKVFRNSPAEEAGLKKGDIILKFKGKEYNNLSNFVEAVKNTPPGTMVNMEIKRNNEIKEIKVKLGKRKKGFLRDYEKELKKFFERWFEKE